MQDATKQSSHRSRGVSHTRPTSNSQVEAALVIDYMLGRFKIQGWDFQLKGQGSTTHRDFHGPDLAYRCTMGPRFCILYTCPQSDPPRKGGKGQLSRAPAILMGPGLLAAPTAVAVVRTPGHLESPWEISLLYPAHYAQDSAPFGHVETRPHCPRAP